ncbi:MAG: AraC family transcriptional regulator, partial [Lachnospiraceae bacterium]|nr:AraC family transcriptional regulator [Lachnospiraceae bacterium]
DELLFQIPEAPEFIEITKPYFTSLRERKQCISYISTNYDAFYGLIQITNTDLYIFIGPYFTIPLSKDSMALIVNSLKISNQEADRIRILLNGMPYGSLHRFLSYLSCLNFAMNQELLTIEDIDCNPDFKNQDFKIRREYTNTAYESREYEFSHNTYLHEMHQLDLIANGDTEGMKKSFATPVPGRHGIIGNDALRQAKNVFIAACTMYTRAAIAGGLDIEAAYNLSDVYIQTSESYGTVADVERLLSRMPLDFAERVEQEVKFKDASQPIISAIHYIREHINQPLKADDIAAHVNLSTSYFLKRFKAETGSGLSEFITKTKIDEACILLSYTDKSLTEISNYLYFSSQSHFQNVFKKITGVTPGQYRNTKKRPIFLARP